MIALLAGGAAWVCGLMFVLWLVHLALRNASVVDPGWAGGLTLLAVYYSASGAYPPRARLIAAMAGVWGVRLALYLFFTRVIGQPEEGRYVELRRQWRTGISWKFLLFFEFQAILCVVLSLPFLLAALDPAPRLGWTEWAGAMLWLAALVGEAVADRQLHRFKCAAENRGRTCRAGLWRYSRHPNYFFEWLIWVAYAIFALGAPYGYLGLTAPALMLYFLFRVTGIPATEAQALRTRGEDYRQYQQSTSAFVPWLPRS